jgi:cellulose synthase/poly-beta-1,6-N-acetylglucosamine synthase-like glycosyltransferase/tetratricopeptide (TPR) repeat protein
MPAPTPTATRQPAPAVAGSPTSPEPMRKPDRSRQLAILLTAVVCAVYFGYRLTTFNLDTYYAGFASLLLYVCEAYGVFVMFLFFVQVWDPHEPPEQPVLPNRSVDIFVPTYNEDPQLLRATLEACSRITYPHTTYLCDDGGTDQRCHDPQKGPASRARAEELKKICAEVGAVYRTRPKNEHAKAGNLNYAFAHTGGEFIIILDADHVPEPHFVSRLIGYFADPQLGYIQTPHAFYNFDNFQAVLDQKRRVYWEEGQLFYYVIQPGRNAWNCPIFAGSAAMFRRKAMEDVGYIATETITEDMHTGMRMNARGWKSLAISDRMVAGQAAPDVTTFHTQRLRWGEGNLSIMAYDNPLTMKGLSPGQRLCYLGSMVHWAGGLFKIGIYATPILMLFTGVPPVREFTWALGIITALYMFVSVWTVNYVSRGFSSFIHGELFCMINFWTQVKGLYRATFMRKFQSFIVTNKSGGRQSASVWPYIRPHAILILVSLLALCWGWERVVSNISNDYTKPMIPTLWVVFHMALALAVIRRGFWPVDRRTHFRHNVHLPVLYAPEDKPDAEPVQAVTADVSDGGIGLITYEKLKPGTRLQLTMVGGGEMVPCAGEVRSALPLTEPGRTTGTGGWQQGVKFDPLTSQESDAISRVCLHYAVPRLYDEYTQNLRDTPLQQAWAGLPADARPAWTRSHPYTLPICLEDPAHPNELPLYTVTEELNRDLVAVMLDRDLPAGSSWRFRLRTPLGDATGCADLVRSTPRTYAARQYHLCVLRFGNCEGTGAAVLHAINNPSTARPLEGAIQPSRGRRTVSLKHLVPAAVMIVAPLLLAALTFFHYRYSDDLFLRDIVNNPAEVSKADGDRIEAIFNETLKQQYPTTDRLVLLMSALNKLDRPIQLDEVTRQLARRDRTNTDLQIALAQALDDAKEYAEAEAVYQRLFRQASQGRLSPGQKRLMLLAAARCAVHSGDMTLGNERFDALMAENPDDANVRDEYAGSLIAAGRMAEARTLLKNLAPNDNSGRVMLAATYSAENKFDKAEEIVREVLSHSPNDDKAKRMLADVLAGKKRYEQASAIYQKLLDAAPNDRTLLLRLGQIALQAKQYDQALPRFQKLCDLGVRSVEAVNGYVDAASGATKLGDTEKKTAGQLYDLLNGEAQKGAADPVYMARLAWVFQRVGEADRSASILQKLLAVSPKDEAVRQQLVGVLVASGRWQEAVESLRAAGRDAEAAELEVSMALRANDLPAATAAARRLLVLRPEDPKARRLLADVLSWQRDWPAALAEYRKLAKATPDDPELERRIAEVTLWSGDNAGAAARYAKLLTEKFDQPELWGPFIDAASGCPELTPEEIALARRLAKQAAMGGKPPEFLSRLAWVVLKTKDSASADQLLAKAVAADPRDPVVRKELSGVLAAAGKTDLAMQILKGLELKGLDRLRLAGVYAAARNFRAAEQEARAVVNEFPDNEEAQKLLADVLAGQQKFAASGEVFAKLLQANPNDPALQEKMAQVALWQNDYDTALERYQTLLEKNWDRPQLWAGFVDAAASAADGKIDSVTRTVVQRLAPRVEATRPNDLEYLGRLAWVLRRCDFPKESAGLLRRLVKLRPESRDLHLQLAQVLDSMGQLDEANEHYQAALRASEPQPAPRR